ncbi:MAG: flagellar motor protein MotB [Planctomycetota bacterium JB042]
MGKKKKHEEHVNHERWLVSYADFITLLFAFFVIMYAMSEVDKNKLKKFSQSVQFAFAHVGTGGTMTQGKNPATLKPQIIGKAWPQGRRDSDPGPFEALRGVVQFLEKSIMTYFLRNENVGIEALEDGRGIIIRLPAERLFAPRSAELRPDRMGFLEDFGSVVASYSVRFRLRSDVRVPFGGDLAEAHELCARRTSSLVRAIQGFAKRSRRPIKSEIEVFELSEFQTLPEDVVRTVFEFRVTP